MTTNVATMILAIAHPQEWWYWLDNALEIRYAPGRDVKEGWHGPFTIRAFAEKCRNSCYGAKEV